MQRRAGLAREQHAPRQLCYIHLRPRRPGILRRHNHHQPVVHEGCDDHLGALGRRADQRQLDRIGRDQREQLGRIADTDARQALRVQLAIAAEQFRQQIGG